MFWLFFLGRVGCLVFQINNQTYNNRPIANTPTYHSIRLNQIQKIRSDLPLVNGKPRGARESIPRVQEQHLSPGPVLRPLARVPDHVRHPGEPSNAPRARGARARGGRGLLETRVHIVVVEDEQVQVFGTRKEEFKGEDNQKCGKLKGRWGDESW